MRIGIICAGDRELAPFLPVIADRHTTQKAMLTFHHGTICGAQVVALYSGVCKVNAAIAAQLLIDYGGADIIINAGTAGGMDPALDIFDTAICTEAAYHDVAANILTEFHPWLNSIYFRADEKLLALSRQAVAALPLEHKVFWGRMVTGESFITDDLRPEINARFAPLTVDMETAGIAHVCHVNGVPFIAIRTVTDNAAHSGSMHFEENCAQAAAIAKDLTVALIERISQSP